MKTETINSTLPIREDFINWLKTKEERFINTKSTQKLFELYTTELLKKNFDEIADIIFEVEHNKI